MNIPVTSSSDTISSNAVSDNRRHVKKTPIIFSDFFLCFSSFCFVFVKMMMIH
ncbi:unnamed protein product [Arabidopsis lyrata]|uniref:Predicted protein n=1 Tax=Arabidopsis lyrata subsp. lyrata TaxID=81972 RepID=D7MGY9_ARALL|nr:predicted protein [Arabidopsis lyrata subsp. lyrata]CAH8276679.1 unnamed protein product [Arabidopsis lyrata]